MSDVVRCVQCGAVEVPEEGDTCSMSCYRLYIVARVRVIDGVIHLGPYGIPLRPLERQPWYRDET